MTRFDAVPVLLTALLLGGCDVTTGGGAGPGSLAAFSAAPGGSASAQASERAAAAAVTHAALGGLIGAKFAAVLDDEDRRLAYHAQIEALDNGAPGAPVPWRNPASGHYGNVVPGPPYDRNGATCRGYSHAVTVKGRLEIARSTACRIADRPWSAAG